MPHLLRYDAGQNVLLVTFKGRVTETAYLDAYDNVEEFIAAHGPCACIVDFSGIDAFELTTDFARKVGVMRPAIPAGFRRVVVAPQPSVYGTARIVAALREGTGAEVVVTASFAEATALFGTSQFIFQAVN